MKNANSSTNKLENLAFVFPPRLSRKIKDLQKDMGAKSAGEVLIKAISLLEVSVGRKVEIQDENTQKWEIDEFEDHKKRVELRQGGLK